MKRIFSVILFLAVLIIDRVSKAWALRHCVEQKILTPYFSCELTFNRGVSWSLFQDVSAYGYMILLAAICALIIVLFNYMYQRIHQQQAFIGEALIAAGAVSNVIDRLIYGGVIDFILLHYQNYVWPVFNIADVAIVVGAFMIFFYHE